MIPTRSFQFAEKLIKEFEEKGFVQSFSNRYLLNMLRENYSQYFKIFDAGCKISAGRLGKCGIYEVFGSRITYYYDERKKEEFVNFLVDKFYSINPNPNRDIQSTFTRMLHVHGLCWGGCVFHNSVLNVKKFKEATKKDDKRSKVASGIAGFRQVW